MSPESSTILESVVIGARLTFSLLLHLPRCLGWGPKVTIADWTKERVRAHVDRYRSSLIGELGQIKAFPLITSWGTVYAAEDMKAGIPTMAIRYRR